MAPSLASLWPVVAFAALSVPADAQYGVTQLVAPSAVSPDGDSDWPSLSFDGRWVAFASKAKDLLGPNGDTNGKADVFLFDRASGSLVRISLGFGGGELSVASFRPSISDDGRFVAYDSLAPDVVTNDTNNSQDIFVFDRLTGLTTRASVSSSGGQANNLSQLAELSADGGVVVFESAANNLDTGDTNQTLDVFWRDLVTGTTRLVSRGQSGQSADDCSGADAKDGPSVSGDGRWVAFQSTATDLVANDTNKVSGLSCWWGDPGVDVFVWDSSNGVCVRASESAAGAQSQGASYHPSLSGDGRYLVFTSGAANLVVGDTNGVPDVLVRDRDADGNGVFDEPGGISMQLASLSSAGTQGNKGAGLTAFGWPGPRISRSGDRVAFHSHSSDLDPLDTNQSADVYLRDLAQQTLELVSVDLSGATSGVSRAPALSGDGSVVAFVSGSDNLIVNDGNGFVDAFVRRSVDPPVAYCTAKVNSLGCTPLVTSVGFASATWAGAFDLTCSSVLNGKQGMLVYSIGGDTQLPFSGGYLCISLPLKRTSLSSTRGGTGGLDCSGVLTLDFNAFVQSGANPALVDGVGVWVQFWSRDGGDPFGSSLSAALAFTLAPP
ncbi:MAG: PD40 domain-containing protein [Planctomycetes bacterium]|nr:PD40 domain-containing protein [Planctomycetota bacterium]